MVFMIFSDKNNKKYPKLFDRINLRGKHAKLYPEILWEKSSSFLDLPFYTSGVYRYTHMPTGMVYYGSSQTLRPRIKSHYSSLGRGDHGNRIFQDLFFESSVKSFRIEYMEVSGQIKEIEQLLMDQTPLHLRINKNRSTPKKRLQK
jgi:GIY-YIG catalytic domain